MRNVRIKLTGLILLLAGAALFPGYMFYKKEQRPRIPGIFPVARYRIVLSSYSEPFLSIIHESAQNWFEIGNVRFGFDSVDNSGDPLAWDPGSHSCADLKELSESRAEIRVMETAQEDPDCTAESCVAVWICEDEILQSDILLKPGIPESNFKATILHNFGHAVGLDHCSPGDSESLCTARTGLNQSNPIAPSVLTTMIPGTIDSLADDDRNGLRALYGVIDGFPLTSSHSPVNGEEIKILSIQEHFFVENFHILPGAAESAPLLSHIYHFTPRTPEQIDAEVDTWDLGKPEPDKETIDYTGLSSSMDPFFAEVTAKLPDMSTRELLTVRLNTIIALDTYARVKREYASLSQELITELESIQTKWIDLQEAVITEEATR